MSPFFDFGETLGADKSRNMQLQWFFRGQKFAVCWPNSARVRVYWGESNFEIGVPHFA